MKLTRIERLLVPTRAKIGEAAGYTVSSKYKLFFDDGTAHEQDYITRDDIRRSPELISVREFTNEGRDTPHCSGDS